ncbi:hypothetical protein HOK51_06505 [Candidatus Woesearchaeota archaeon]|jgi:Zn-dependent protease|nr:hypothetical protein [Candidatus Woesearchaeota archaeon]MBT6519475.1 hypothetical protein [Candidatus Woesearchaeota archaeon]MBT7368223.1 hypothetical protein [Candidatus Woesearchaeota archaeon]
MVFFNILEIIDIIAMSLVIGFIFKDMFRAPKHMGYDPLSHYKYRKSSTSAALKNFFSDDFKFAVMVTAPAVIFHEFGHKFVALAMGFTAEFHAAYGWLVLGIVMKLISSGFVFFVPAYVSIYGAMHPLQHSLIAFAGPLVNLIIFTASWLLLKNKQFARTHKKWIPALHMTKRINLFLFVFNMIPIPGFDGSKVFGGLLKWIGIL